VKSLLSYVSDYMRMWAAKKQHYCRWLCICM